MPSSTSAAPASRKLVWAGRIITAVPVLFLTFDSVIHLLNIPVVVEAFTRLGYPSSIAPELGILEIICLAVYLVPRRSIVGAILLTGYLGGAVATHLRVGDPLFSTVLFPVYVGALFWGGLYLRDPRLRALIAAATGPSPARSSVAAAVGAAN